MFLDIAQHDIKYYARRIRSGHPYALVRYGEGEWKAITPSVPPKHPKNVWATKQAIVDFRTSIILAPEHDDYLVGIWHIPHLKNEIKIWPKVEAWLAEKAPPDLRWVDGRVFRTATERAAVYPFIKAIRESPLPIVLVGPKRMAGFHQHIAPLAKHVIIPGKECYPHKARVREAVLGFGSPALVLLSASGLSKILTRELWNEIGHHSYIIDCGALWDVMLGFKTRSFHRKITQGMINKCLRGK